MLQAFRSRGLSSVIYGVLIAGMVLVFVLGFNPSAGKKTAALGEQCAARVKGHCVTPKDHLAAYRILIPRNEQGQLLAAKAKQMGLLRVSLDGLVERELLVSDAERLGITVTDDEVTDEIYDGFIHVSLPSDKPAMGGYLRVQGGKIYAGFRDPKTHQFDLKVYERTIKAAMGRSPTEFREEQARELLASKVRDLIRTPVRVSESEALSAYIDERSTSTLNSITVRPSYVAKYLPPPSQKDADAWAADPVNKKLLDEAITEHKAPHLRHILIKVDPTASDADKEAAKARLLAAVARVKHGEAFAVVAKDVSEDSGSAINGGDVGPDTDGFVAPFKDAADKLKPGEMTDTPVETQFGYHAIRRDPVMTDEQMQHLMALELFTKVKADDAAKTMADTIQARLKAGTDAQKVLDDAIATLMPTGASKPDAAKASAPGGARASDKAKAAPAEPKGDRADTDPSRPQIVTSAPFNRGGEPIPGLSPENDAKVIGFAFSAKDKDGMDDILRSEGNYVLVSVKEHKTATKDEFAKDKEVYLQTLVRQKQDEAFALYMTRLKTAAKNEIKIDEAYLASKMGTGKTADGGPAPAPTDEDEDEGP
jgi:peptidyl-prolyl cis-trans isomerase D